jgi:hypothetical protein
MNEHETNGFIPNDDTATETVNPFFCPKCDKSFKNAVALRMHDIRKHQNRGWSTTQNFGKRQSREQVLAKKREYNRKWRLKHGMKVRPASLMQPQRKRLQTLKRKALAPIPAPPTPGLVTYCPRCGCNIKVVSAAIAFGDKQ